MLCSHCLLPAGLRAMRRTVNGESCAFCCYGCCIAFQVKNGKSEEWEAAWLLIRLGVGGFLSMNIMLFSILLYTDTFTGADARMIPWIHLLLWIFATPAVIILGGPFLHETWLNGLQGRLTSSALIVIGVGAAYLYSAFAVIERGHHVYFDTATMVLMLFTLGRLLEAAGRARAARDLEPLLAAERESVVVVQDGMEIRRPVREVEAGMLVRVRPGERIAIDGVVVEGESHTDEAVITGESRLVTKAVGSPVVAGSINLDGPAADPKRRCGNRNALGAGLPIGSGGAHPAQPEAARRRPRGWRLGAPCSSPRRADGAVLGAVAVVRSVAVYWTFGAGRCLSLCRGPCGTARGLARHRAAGAAWLPRPRSRGA